MRFACLTVGIFGLCISLASEATAGWGWLFCHHHHRYYSASGGRSLDERSADRSFTEPRYVAVREVGFETRSFSDEVQDAVAQALSARDAKQAELKQSYEQGRQDAARSFGVQDPNTGRIFGGQVSESERMFGTIGQKLLEIAIPILIHKFMGGGDSDNDSTKCPKTNLEDFLNDRSARQRSAPNATDDQETARIAAAATELAARQTARKRVLQQELEQLEAIEIRSSR